MQLVLMTPVTDVQILNTLMEMAAPRIRAFQETFKIVIYSVLSQDMQTLAVALKTAFLAVLMGLVNLLVLESPILVQEAVEVKFLLSMI